jgi:hypothetical protein
VAGCPGEISFNVPKVRESAVKKIMKLNKVIKASRGVAAVCLGVTSFSIATAVPLSLPELEVWRNTRASNDYVGIARAYADYMIAHGRDVYGGKQTPLFVTGLDRRTGMKIAPPFAHVKRKPFMPGWERDRELRGSDRNYGQADPLDQLVLLKLMHRLTEVTSDKHYAAEADKTAAWWMANAQSPIGLYPWGTHTHWNVEKDSGAGQFEFNHVWPFWKLNPEALQHYAMGLWDHYIRDKETGDFNRHAHSHKHGPGGGMEFPWPGSAMIATWVEAYLANPDSEYVRAISTVLKRWESLRDENNHLAPCSQYGEWAWYMGYMIAANRLDDSADRIEGKEPELAKKMRDYGRKNDAAYLKVSDKLLNVKAVGPVKSYLRATGGYNPERLDIIGGPWQDRKDYAGFAVMLYERMKRNDSPDLQKRYRQAVLDTAEIYLSINPEVQWSVWGVNVANAMRLMLAAHELTGNLAYLHRADHFADLAVDLFLDDASPLPKLTSQDDYYEIESVTDPSGDVWMLVGLDVYERLAKLDEPSERSARMTTGSDPTTLSKAMREAIAQKQGAVWDCTTLAKPSASVSLAYGTNGEKTLFLSRREAGFSFTKGLTADSLELIASDFINKIPSLDEARPFNGLYRRKFSGKHREPSTARYGGFKDVLDQVELRFVNHSSQAAKVTVTTTFHDSWDDRETKDQTVTVEPGKKVLVSVVSPEKRFIRRFDFKTETPGAVKLSQFAFAMTPRSKLNPLTPGAAPADLSKEAIVFLIAGQSNAGGVAAFSSETNENAGMAKKHPTIPGSTAKEVGIPIVMNAYPRCFIWGRGFERLTPGKNLKGGYNDPYRHGIELPMAMLLEKQFPDADKFFIKHGPGGHNLHTQWKAEAGPDYKNFKGQLDGAMGELKKRYQKVRVIGLYWDQGESDRPKANEYGKNLRALFASFRKDTGITDLPIFVRKHLFQHGDESFVPILEAQVEVTKEDAHAHLLDLDLGTREKNFKAWAWTDKNGHLSSKAYLELSNRIIKTITPLRVDVPAESSTNKHE